MEQEEHKLRMQSTNATALEAVGMGPGNLWGKPKTKLKPGPTGDMKSQTPSTTKSGNSGTEREGASKNVANSDQQSHITGATNGVKLGSKVDPSLDSGGVGEIIPAGGLKKERVLTLMDMLALAESMPLYRKSERLYRTYLNLDSAGQKKWRDEQGLKDDGREHESEHLEHQQYHSHHHHHSQLQQHAQHAQHYHQQQLSQQHYHQAQTQRYLQQHPNSQQQHQTQLQHKFEQYCNTQQQLRTVQNQQRDQQEQYANALQQLQQLQQLQHLQALAAQQQHHQQH